ncbi:MAG: hypothetical protein H0T45_09205 [Pyrinomonadaceae bacterium]|nr:hypothetical protein [Pyrinomonadaceae bacterium]
MKRTAVLSILLMLGLVTTSLPLSESIAYWSNSAEAKRQRKRYRRHTRAWWRRRRAQLRRQRERREARDRRRDEAAQLLRRSHGVFVAPRAAKSGSPATLTASTHVAPAAVSVALPVPNSWSVVAGMSRLSGETRFNVKANDGRVSGTAAWSRVAALPDQTSVLSPRTKLLAGVPTTSLRRIVIDRMIAAGGWVINDTERQLGGRSVFVVFAQSTGADGARQNLAFYFTEFDGQIFSLATTATANFADQLAAQSEQFVAAVHERRHSAQATR